MGIQIERIEVVRRNEGYANEHWSVDVYCDDAWAYHPYQDQVFQLQAVEDGSGRTLGFSVDPDTGLAAFFAHNPSDERGFGGSVFTVTDESGDEHSFAGPWSSRCGVMNKRGFTPTIECVLRDDKHITGIATAITVTAVKEQVEAQGFSFIRRVTPTDETWVILKDDEEAS